jgi:hypothetical protein
MATTTNYGWTTPDDTALVKDGAAAIRTLGTSVDTTTKALNPSTTLGDIEYRSSTANTNTRLGIGSTGNVLTVAGGVPTWAAPAGGGTGFAFVNKTTFSGVTSQSINNVFTSTYTNYKIIVKIVGLGNDLNLRMRASGTDNTSSEYWNNLIYGQGAVVTSAGSASANTSFLKITQGNTGNGYCSIDLYSPQATALTGISGLGTGRYSGQEFVGSSKTGEMTVTTSYDGFTIFCSSNMTGEVLVYGYTNS